MGKRMSVFGSNYATKTALSRSKNTSYTSLTCVAEGGGYLVNMNKSYIGLIDCNNFFVSCERLFRPDLENKPVVVLSSNDGCVVARSQEIKDIGIPMGVPYFQVKDKLSEIKTAVFSSHFALYRDISRRIFNLVMQEVAVFEQYSIDEAFFILRDTNPQQAALSLKTYVERCVGVPVSVGIAATKTQAKYANETTKRKSGAWYMSQDIFARQAVDIPLYSIWGVGAGRSQALAKHGLQTVADLCAADRARVQRLFGIEGARLQAELSGQAAYKVSPRRVPQQSIMSSRSFRAPSTKKAVVEDALAYHIRLATADLRAQGQVASVVQVLLRPSRHGIYALRGGSGSVTLEQPTNDTFEILHEATRLLRALFEPAVPYQKVGIVLSGLKPAGTTQLTLYQDTAKSGRPQLFRAIDAVNTRYGQDTLRIGSAIAARTWQAKCDQLSPAYTTRWSDLKTVVA